MARHSLGSADMDANEFFDGIAMQLGCDRDRAEGLALVVLHELRDRLTAKEAGDVAAQLPKRLRVLWNEGAVPERQPIKIHAAELVGRVRKGAGLPDDVEAERAIRAVFRRLRTLLGSTTGLEGEAWDVFSVLPKDMKPLWIEEDARGQESHS
jgi:uncharacterized protein (DUF2267 family)